LYALDVARLRSDPDAGSPPSAQEAYERVAAHFEMHEGSRAFAKELVIRVSENQSSLDEAIAGHARNWRVSRMAAVDRNVLRLGAFELIHTETPIGVVLDEAVELARRFGSDTSPAFVNGILDALAHAVRGVES
jgi:N utilization substance protein B